LSKVKQHAKLQGGVSAILQGWGVKSLNPIDRFEKIER
jgi:hypothetical protein